MLMILSINLGDWQIDDSLHDKAGLSETHFGYINFFFKIVYLTGFDSDLEYLIYVLVIFFRNHWYN